MTTLNPSIQFSEYIWFKIGYLSEIPIQSGALVPSDVYVMFMDYSLSVFLSEIFIFASEMVVFSLVEFLSSENLYSSPKIITACILPSEKT